MTTPGVLRTIIDEELAAAAVRIEARFLAAMTGAAHPAASAPVYTPEPRSNAVAELERRITGLFRAGLELKAGDVTERLGITRQRATKSLNALLARGTLTKRGVQKGTRYRLK